MLYNSLSGNCNCIKMTFNHRVLYDIYIINLWHLLPWIAYLSLSFLDSIIFYFQLLPVVLLSHEMAHKWTQILCSPPVHQHNFKWTDYIETWYSLFCLRSCVTFSLCECINIFNFWSEKYADLFLSPVAMVDCSVRAPLMLAFYGHGAPG